MIRTTLLLLALALPIRSFANCYVLQNNTNVVQTWHFAYSQPMEGAKTLLRLAPHASFPADRQWCWTRSRSTTPSPASIRLPAQLAHTRLPGMASW